MVDIRNEQITILNNRVRELEQELADLKRKNGVLEATNCHHDPHYCNQLEKELAAREEDITKLGETIDGYREREAGLEKELAELKESKKKDVSWMNEQIEKLTADSEKWFGKYTVETGRRDKALAIISEEFHHADSHLVEGEYVEVMRVLKRVRGVLEPDPAKNVKTVKDDGV